MDENYKAVDAKKEIVSIINTMAGKYSPDTIFSDWVHCSALTIQNACWLHHNEVWKKRENEYIAITKKYEQKEILNFGKMLYLLAYALEMKICDMLGEIYMESGCGSKHTGQFFTPFHLSVLTADLSIPKEISEDCKFTINEPSCGAGGMIIAAAEAIKRRGKNYQTCMKVVAQDLDWRSVYMTYVQLSLLGIDAEVVQGNTLSDPYVRGKYPAECIFRTPKRAGVLL